MVAFTANRTFSQTVNMSANATLPSIELDKSKSRSYHMANEYYDFSIDNSFLIKTKIAGDFTTRNDSVQWKNVYESNSKSLNSDFPGGEMVNYFEGFKYKQDVDILSADFFKKHFPKANPIEMNLIWDAWTFELIAYENWDSLKLNKEFRAMDMSSELEIAYGTFDNRDIRITWLGISEINNEICAILKYSVMNNPLSLEYENMTMQGRSHYWGEIYVSLSDKQIEYASLTEDVLMDVKDNKQENSEIKYTVRYITLSKFD